LCHENIKSIGLVKMEAKFMELGVETFKLALYLLLNILAKPIVELAIPIFQVTTQINEMSLSFTPKIFLVVVVIISTMAWMMNMMIEFATKAINLIPKLLY